MPASPDDLFAFLDALGISCETRQHEALFTVEDGLELKATIPGGHTKNLFMKDKSGALLLISAEAHNPLRLNQLHRLIGTRRLSFGPADLMLDVLGVTPGSVTGFALINDRKAQRVRFLADAALMAHDRLNFHPLVNTATTTISRGDFTRFVEATGHTIETIDFAALA